MSFVFGLSIDMVFVFLFPLAPDIAGLFAADVKHKCRRSPKG